jgi:hypothetical protein
MGIFVQLFSGKEYFFEIFDKYRFINLKCEFLEVVDEKDFDGDGEVIFFSKNRERFEMTDFVIDNSTYYVFVTDYLIDVIYEKNSENNINKIKLCHNYQNVPYNKTTLQIKISEKDISEAYKYIYDSLFNVFEEIRRDIRINI